MENLKNFESFVNERKKTNEETFAEMAERDRKKIHDIERKEKARFSKMEADAKEKQKRMWAEAEKESPKYFKTNNKTKKTTSENRRDLYYSSEYKEFKPRNGTQLKKLLKGGAVEQVTYGTYHFSIKDDSGTKFYFKFIIKPTTE
jgi:hypothetical protein